uniref:Queuosine 5'-phosphate N-glycosylase/hydrolase n=1 Tax=Dunaliella tertiolecta TaxID=3047 RepID=A0A7S3VJW6_DUNTE|mmetsp:Transcript_24890/g.67790  ORF Transcript_24890/g.67790 Transcript_24890/m.67790 type:complete len:322 (+) Transcript_24890:124-1089(+)
MGSVVRESARYVCSQSRHVTVVGEGISRVVAGLTDEELRKLSSPASFDADLHFVDETSEALTVQYLLVVDALNFCFWPDPELEYAQLSLGIKRALQQDPRVLDSSRLAAAKGADVRALLGWKRDLPQQEERARLLREVGHGLLKHFGGSAANLVAAAGGSAVTLVELLAAHFPGFRDHAIYKGQQVFFYKRAQIFVGDVYGALQGKGLGAFHDIQELTMFADYRVPVVLRVMGILEFSSELESKIGAGQELPAGGEEELEIRAATITAVEDLKDALSKSGRCQAVGAAVPITIQLDWFLWEVGEREREAHPPAHHTLTIYY